MVQSPCGAEIWAMKLEVEIDKDSGFCAGVIRAINTAEKYLENHPILYSLGAIVHNESELNRLRDKGLETISQLNTLTEADTVIIRAHGEPPSTYQKAQSAKVEVIDCTCPVVLKLQKSIVEAYQRTQGRVVIFGKVGHAEVLGLLGQVNGDAIVVENLQMLNAAVSEGKIDLTKPIEIFSQTTKSPSEYEQICSRLSELMGAQKLSVHNTICSQVANRHAKLSQFAKGHDVVIFVSGKESSNGKVLYDLCKSVNTKTYHVASEEDIAPDWFTDKDKVGVCGATSTPKWLLEKVSSHINTLSL